MLNEKEKPRRGDIIAGGLSRYVDLVCNSNLVVALGLDPWVYFRLYDQTYPSRTLTKVGTVAIIFGGETKIC